MEFLQIAGLVKVYAGCLGIFGVETQVVELSKVFIVIEHHEQCAKP